MRALSELFEATTLVVPCLVKEAQTGEVEISGRNLSIAPLTIPHGQGFWRKLALSGWLLRNIPTLMREILRADAVHTPIPGDIGTIGMLLACLMRRPLFVRHCGNWFVQKTAAEHFWKWFIERFAGGRRVMLATGGAQTPPSSRNAAVQWIFSTSLEEDALKTCLTHRVQRKLDQPRLIIACRQDVEKGTGLVIESLPQIIEHIPAVRLDVVGDGPALSAFKELANHFGVSERVTFHGKVGHDQVMDLLKSAHLFCYPTRASEGFPKVVLDALACGLPVVTTNVSVLPQLIGGGGGILIDRPSTTLLAQAVVSILREEQSYQTMSTIAIQTAQAYSLERWRDTISHRLQTAWGVTNPYA
jgi:hypothetical protein